MTAPFKDRSRWSQAAGLVFLAAILACLLVYRFTSRTPVEKERIRAHLILQNIYQLELAYFRENGTYLPINRENNGEILNLNHVTGRFRYRVKAAGLHFVATAEADLDRDGRTEVWQVDPLHPEPILIRQD